MARKILSQEDVEQLLSDPSGKTRAQTAAKIAQDFDADRLTPEEREMAREIFRNLKENPAVPHEVAKALAQDVDSVALPILQFSEALTDVIEIVRSQGASKGRHRPAPHGAGARGAVAQPEGKSGRSPRGGEGARPGRGFGRPADPGSSPSSCRLRRAAFLMAEALTDEDLIEIVRSQGASKQVAIARRPTVSETVSTALVDTGRA